MERKLSFSMSMSMFVIQPAVLGTIWKASELEVSLRERHIFETMLSACPYSKTKTVFDSLDCLILSAACFVGGSESESGLGTMFSFP